MQARRVEHFAIESFAATLRLWIRSVAAVAPAIAVVRLFVAAAFSFAIEAVVQMVLGVPELRYFSNRFRKGQVKTT